MQPVRVLWIEDGALADLAAWAAPLLTRDRFELSIALDASHGLQLIADEEFDVVIVDVRLPPGTDSRWITVYSSAGNNKIEARLGLQLLYSLFQHPGAAVKLSEVPTWVTPKRFAILTIEAQWEVAKDLKELGLQFYEEKNASTESTVLLDLVDRMSAR